MCLHPDTCGGSGGWGGLVRCSPRWRVSAPAGTLFFNRASQGIYTLQHFFYYFFEHIQSHNITRTNPIASKETPHAPRWPVLSSTQGVAVIVLVFVPLISPFPEGL
jgi:hypothetical protein